MAKNNHNEHEHRSMIKSAGVIGIWTAISRVTGLIRDQVQAYFLGTSHSADAFRVAFALPNMLRRLFGEGAMTASFVPVFTDFVKGRDKKDSWYFANNCLFSLGFILVAITLIGVIFSGTFVELIAAGFKNEPGKLELAASLARIMFIYTFFIGVTALLAAILNTLGVFGAPSFTPILLNLSIIIISVVFANRFEEPSYAFAVGVIVGGLLQMIILIPFVKKKGMKFKPVLNARQKELRIVGKRMLPGILAVGVAQVNTIVSMRIASTLEEGSIASLYHANRLEELTLGIFVISIATVILPLLSRHAYYKDYEALKDSLTFALRITLLITIPATIGLIILREPIVRVLFMHGSFNEKSLALTTHALLFYAIGLMAFASAKIFAPAFFSLKDVRTPVYISAVAVVVNLIGCLLLKEPLQNGGIALAASISAFVNAGLLLIVFNKRFGNLDYRKILMAILKILIASLLMAAPIYVFTTWSGGFGSYRLIIQLAILLGLIGFAAVIYFVSLKMMRSLELREVMDLVRRRQVPPEIKN